MSTLHLQQEIILKIKNRVIVITQLLFKLNIYWHRNHYIIDNFHTEYYNTTECKNKITFVLNVTNNLVLRDS